MTGTQILTLFQSIVDDQSIDDVSALQIMNLAKDVVEEERPWRFLLTVDSSKTASTGDTYLSTKALPTAFRTDYRMFVGSSFIEYYPILFEERYMRRSEPRRYYLDMASSVFALTGTISASSTIYLYYIKTTDDIAAGTSPVWPSRFHPYLAFKMAEIYSGGIDGDEVNFRMTSAQQRVAREMHDAMVSWDERLKLQAMNNRGGMADEAAPFDLGLL